ncbi:MAG: DUF362 domain-containing protein [Candidatus Omnitrophota bacterium]
MKRIKLEELLVKKDFLLAFFDSSGFASKIKKNSFIGMKLHFGEKGNKSFVNPKILRPLVNYLKNHKTKPFLFDTNTLYRGQRLNAVDHLLLASQHGFASLGIPIMIADGLKGNDYREVEINKNHYKKCFIASLCMDMDFILCISHLTGHMITGFGGSMKNLGMGLASRRGKLSQHSDIAPSINQAKCQACGICRANCPAASIEQEDNRYFIDKVKCIGCAQCISVCPYAAVVIHWSDEHILLQEKMVEYAYAAVKDKDCAYFNFCLFITKECDCLNKETKPAVEDIGVIFGYDPVAVDKASIDLLIKNENKDVLRQFHPEIDYISQFDYAEKIGLGTANYNLIEL